MSEIKLDESQMEAVDFAVRHRFSIINGGAGCGKTTIIEVIARKLKDERENIELCAFAGKAAARLRQATKLDSMTIHRILQWRGERFMRGKMENSTVIIDEASMVCSSLFAEIVKRKPKRLILVGDEAQLPPVGKGQPFHDLIRMFPQSVRTLTTCYRNREAIFQSALKVRSGQMPERNLETTEEKWTCIPTGDPRKTHECILEMVKKRQLDFAQDIILVPRNEDETNCASSVDSLNNDIVAIVNPRKGNEKFCPGDRVINTVNTPDLDIWNGTTATVHAIDDSGKMYLDLDYPAIDEATGMWTNQVVVPKDKTRNFRLAYALTVHKSQGSQYRKVVVVALRRDVAMLLDRSMLYTAITRARCECVVIGEMNAFATALTRDNRKHTVMQLLYKNMGEKNA